MGSIFSDRFENYYVSCNAHCDRRIIWVFPRNFKCVGMGGFFGKIINIGNNMLSYIQDRLVEMMVRETVCRNIESVSRELLIK